jgi:hypothetical protein
MDGIPQESAAVERSLLQALTWWAAGSVAAGAVLWAGGRRAERGQSPPSGARPSGGARSTA